MSLTKVSYSMVNGAPFNVLDFGADPTGVNNSTDAFAGAASAINAAGGGKLVIPKGTYVVGKETFVSGTGYVSTEIFRLLSCTKPVVIEGNGAVIQYANGLHFGTFNTTTGAPVVTTPPYYGPGLADPGKCFEFSNCVQVEIRDLEINGNITNFVIGGQWGDTGWQLGHIGVAFYACKLAKADNLYIHHFGVDGVYIEPRYSDGTSHYLDLNAEIYPHELSNIKSYYNGRQGMSWVGGNNLTCVNCDFSFTGKNGTIQSSPSAGIDMEPGGLEFCKNGTFINCTFYDNYGMGLLTVGDVSKCTFVNCSMIGTTQASLWDQGKYQRYYGCKIIGKGWYFGTAAGDANITHAVFDSCLLSMDVADSPDGTIYGVCHNIAGSPYAEFNSCIFTADTTHTLPISGGITYNNCKFFQTGSGTFYMGGNFTGYNICTHSGSYDTSPGVFNYGRYEVNGSQQYNITPQTRAVNFGAYTGSVVRNNTITIFNSYSDWVSLTNTVAIQGDIVFNTNAASGQPIGWICTVSGTVGSPTGTWVAMANL